MFFQLFCLHTWSCTIGSSQSSESINKVWKSCSWLISVSIAAYTSTKLDAKGNALASTASAPSSVKMPMALGAIAAKVVLPILPWPTTTILGARTRRVLDMDLRSNAMLVFQFNGWFGGFGSDVLCNLFVGFRVQNLKCSKLSKINFSFPTEGFLAVRA